MSQRNFSVVVLPDRWDGAADELARRLTSLTHQSADRLATALTRGPLTIDADLRREEAERLCTQLERLGVPAAARDDDGETVVETEPAERDDTADVATGETEEGDPEFDEFDELEDSLESVFESTDLEADSESSFDELESVDGGVVEEAEPEGDGGGDAEPGPSTAGDGWEDVLGTEPKAGATANDEPNDGADEPVDESDGGLTILEDDDEKAPSLEELGGDDSEPPRDEQSPAPGDDSSPPPQPPSPGPPGSEAGPSGRSPGAVDEVGGADQPSAPMSEPQDETDAAEGAGGAQPASPGMPASPGPPSEGDPKAGFDTQSMTEALSESTEGGDFGGGTFDDRPEHIPALAALLSLLAPGAGQIYNGDAEDAWEQAAYAPLLWPWYRSVRDALEKARAIREREAPKPEPGTFVASLKHLATLYIAVGAVVVAGYVGIRVAVSQFRTEPPDEPAITETSVRRAVQKGKLQVHGARIDAWETAGKQKGQHKEESEDEREPERTESERAERMFRIGHTHCKRRDLRKCQETMQKVAEFDSPYRRRAYRLQTWANMQQNSSKGFQEMPEVSLAPGVSSDENDDANAPEPDASGGNVAEDADDATLSDVHESKPDVGTADTRGD